jgi:CHAT domain-containing protein/tetratricopeptide (TPR) repeat protein
VDFTFVPAGILGWFGNLRRNFRPWAIPCALALLFLFLIHLRDSRPGSAQAAYDYALNIFQRGNLAISQQESEQDYRRFRISNPEWAAKFQLLQAETMVRRGMYEDALHLLAGFQPGFNDTDQGIRKLAIESDALTHQQQLSSANIRLIQAEHLCKSANYPSCGYVLRTRGLLAVRQGDPFSANQVFFESLLFARSHQDQWLEVGALNNLGLAAMQTGRYDEAGDWLRYAHQAAVKLGSDYWTQLVVGNLGWAYYQLGDDERSLTFFLEAEKSAARLGNIHNELNWTSTAGYVYHDTGDLARAAQSYRQALDLARQIDSKEDIANALEDLAQVSVETGKLDEADGYLNQVTPMESAGNIRLSTYVKLTRGMLAAARSQDQQAETLFRTIQSNPANPTSSRLSAGDELARLYDQQGNGREAERTYKTTLAAFESARAQLKHEDSQLPFAANATRIYDDYIHLLVSEGRSDAALAAADQSRAQTLAQGLGVAESKATFHPAVLNPRQIAQKAGATLLFYWLGTEHAYLWAITPARVTLIPLPAQADIVARTARYRKALLDAEDPLEARNEDGQALYRLLVAPAAKLIRRNAPVMILADGALSQLNFETLLVPGPSPEAGQSSNPGAEMHYLLDDATLLSAPSLAMLAAAKPARAQDRNLLLLGNPVSPNQDYPSLPLFGAEMTQIERHFGASHLAAFSGRQATPAAYLTGNPAQYAYIHFVSHAVASRTDPLDSAIILSGSALSGSALSGGEASGDSFKLYARDIMQHPIDARLVTISACYGSGTRSYAGEGLVGLSWAFLRAGAHSVIGALWEVSDDSTPRLMDALYQGLEAGQEPAVALRGAKLKLLHSQSRFRMPFYWAPFQIYTRR